MRNNEPTEPSTSSERATTAERANRGRRSIAVALSDSERAEVIQLLAAKATRRPHARRLQVILLSSLGVADRVIAHQAGISRFHLSRIRRRFQRGGVAGLAERPRSGRKNAVPSEIVERLVATATSSPPPGVRRWTLGRMARTYGLSRSVVHKILRARGVPPYGRPTPART